ncbi:transglycosylase domain-containing protein [Aquibacillus kalidii]|uniref:transglycosylase domain-containing protein n=1 Tax=Aquibacillus kalidii TaxID=2762597 RepID=UPI001F257111|nr:transglycosylase domain-containing protein [Aquibacillus kalidii]
MFQWLKELLRKIKKRPVRWFLIATVAMVCFIIGLVGAIFGYAYTLGPPPLTNQQNTVYYSASGDVIGEEHGLESRYWVELEDIDPKLVQATVMTEDQRFYDHNGFDYKRIVGAAIKDIKAMAMVEGASTITQQYARNLYLSHDKTWKRKLKEALYTIRLEMFYDKDKILEGYLNTIYYGHGAYGAEAASRYFFDSSSSNLSWANAALIAGIPKGPSYYSPFHNFENAKKRQEQILTNLANKGVITEEEKTAAINQKLALTEPKDRTVKTVAPYFQDVVFNELQQILDEDMESIRSGGYQVYTTLNVEDQKQFEKTVKETIDPSSEIQVGAIAMDPKTGAITSLIGGKNYKTSQFNRAVQAKRMPGSTFKPFLYYAALENGYTATTPLMSKPTNFQLADGKVYQPSNYNGYYADKPITLAQALALSDNIYAVKTNLYLDPKTLVNTAHRFGIDSELPAVPSLALGTASVSVEEMVSGYSMIANGGSSVEAHTIKKITDLKGNIIYEREKEKGKKVLDTKSTFILSNLMTGMFDESLNGYMRVTGASIADDLSRTYAGKSGTTQSDNWMIGFSPDLVTGVWTGYDNNQDIELVQEHHYAKDIWAAFMEAAHRDHPPSFFNAPDGVVGAYVDPVSGELATPYCEQHRLMYFEEGEEPTSYCSLHKPKDAKKEDEKQEPEKNDKDSKNGLFDWIPFGGD